MASFKSVKFKVIRYFLTFEPLFLGITSCAQFMNIDSYLVILKTAKNDTNKVLLRRSIWWPKGKKI
jgi:hypothetical protein